MKHFFFWNAPSIPSNTLGTTWTGTAWTRLLVDWKVSLAAAKQKKRQKTWPKRFSVDTIKSGWMRYHTLLGTKQISSKMQFWRWFSFPKVGYVCFQEGMNLKDFISRKKLGVTPAPKIDIRDHLLQGVNLTLVFSTLKSQNSVIISHELRSIRIQKQVKLIRQSDRALWKESMEETTETNKGKTTAAAAVAAATTNNKQQTSNNKQQTTTNTNNKQQTTSTKQQATSNKQQTNQHQQQHPV